MKNNTKRKEYLIKYYRTHKKEQKEYHKRYNQDPVNKQRQREKQKIWRDAHKERIKEKNRIQHFAYRSKRRDKELREKYGINVSRYNEILLSQNNVCAICSKLEVSKHKNGGVKRLSVDHDHSTGKARGLLCTNCNVALGGFKDNLILLKRATKYLESFNN